MGMDIVITTKVISKELKLKKHCGYPVMIVEFVITIEIFNETVDETAPKTVLLSKLFAIILIKMSITLVDLEIGGTK